MICFFKLFFFYKTQAAEMTDFESFVSKSLMKNKNKIMVFYARHYGKTFLTEKSFSSGILYFVTRYFKNNQLEKHMLLSNVIRCMYLTSI